MKVYQYTRCSTCRNSLKFLDAHDIPYEKIEITETPPSIEELAKMLKFQNGDIKKLFNTSGQVYREMQVKDKLPAMSKEEAFELLNSNGKLVKRPFVLGKDKGLVGFKEDKWKEELL
ncbi:MAG: arsenate reductase [Halioglobus sp.]|jgi:arsenate reductase